MKTLDLTYPAKRLRATNSTFTREVRLPIQTTEKSPYINTDYGKIMARTVVVHLEPFGLREMKPMLNPLNL